MVLFLRYSYNPIPSYIDTRLYNFLHHIIQNAVFDVKTKTDEYNHIVLAGNNDFITHVSSLSMYIK